MIWGNKVQNLGKTALVASPALCWTDYCLQGERCVGVDSSSRLVMLMIIGTDMLKISYQ